MGVVTPLYRATVRLGLLRPIAGINWTIMTSRYVVHNVMYKFLKKTTKKHYILLLKREFMHTRNTFLNILGNKKEK